jgi:hypothetical protein
VRREVARTRRSYLAALDGPLVEPVDPAAAALDPQRVAACFRTAERSIDTSLLSDRIRAAVEAHPRIDLFPGVDVQRVGGRTGSYRVVGLEADRARTEGPFDGVVNASWANREVIDARSGRPSRRRALNRLKLGVNLWNVSRGIGIPSTTFVLGPYGDVVRFPSGRTYLSWYPAGMIGAIDASEPVDWRARLAAVDRDRIVAETVAGLRRLAPGLDPSLGAPGAEAVVEGGAIYARGRTDIDDAASELHQRFAIGPVRHGGYVSLDPGKLTTAPRFALQTADLLRPRARLVARNTA